ncbi:MAG: aquaporin [Mycobacterium sp.]|nr:aquaporin [Mycobacterium sp.]
MVTADTGAIPSGPSTVTTARGPRPSVKYAFEAVGTFLLVLTVGAAVESGSPLAVLGIGAVLIAMVYSGGYQSGGHYNPAVTLAALVRRWIGVHEAIAYWVVQFGAGLLAAAVVGTIVKPIRAAATAAITLTGHTLVAAFAVELLVVFALCYLATSGHNGDDSSYGLAIGFTTVVGAFAVAVISGGAFNPVVPLGVAVTLSVYLVAQVLGGITAGITLLALNPTMSTRPSNNERQDND